MSWDRAAQSDSEHSPLFRSMYGNEGAMEVVQEKDWRMNTGLHVVRAATVRNWQNNDKAFEGTLKDLRLLAKPNVTTCVISDYAAGG